jgi:hypothetical protein
MVKLPRIEIGKAMAAKGVVCAIVVTDEPVSIVKLPEQPKPDVAANPVAFNSTCVFPFTIIFCG